MLYIPLRGIIPLGGNKLFAVWYREMTVCACTDIPYFRLRGDAIFPRKLS